MTEITDSPIKNGFKGWPMIVFWAAMIVFAGHACTHMVAAGDTWVAMACGRHFVNHGVDTVEPFSANSHKAGPSDAELQKYPEWTRSIIKKIHPTGWINQNWLTHVIFYTFATTFGSDGEYNYDGLVYWKFIVTLLAVVCTFYICRVLGVSRPVATIAACFAIFIGRSFIDIRPAVFSNLITPLYLLILLLATYRNIRYIWLIVPLIVFWCNVHGGYIYAFMMLVPFIGLHFVTIPFNTRFVTIGFKGVIEVVCASITAFVAMIIFNPFHLTNLTHTFEVSISKHAESWRSVNEWHPAFEWTNPVGVSFPFLVGFVLAILLLIYWLGAKCFRPLPRDARPPQLKAQDTLFALLYPFYGAVLATTSCVGFFILFSVIDTTSANILIAIGFVTILVLSAFLSIHFIYFAAAFALIVLYFSDSQPAYAGRYIYPFVLVPSFALIHCFSAIFAPRSIFKRTHVLIAVGTTLISAIIMLVFINPFGGDSLVDRFLQLGTIKRIWYPAFEFQGGRTHFHHPFYFQALYALNVIAILVLCSYPVLRRYSNDLLEHIQVSVADYQWPKLDIPFLSIATLTVYMAISSRRFIPLAAVVASPMVALFFEQATKMIIARLLYNKTGKLSLPEMPVGISRTIILGFAVVVIGFGTVWGAKYKRIYLDPWPSDDVRDSVFMRMTASQVKPFEVMQFVRDNKLSGNMFNHWTEGGAVAFGQEPDPETGFTPLKLFMDGRAQAAYDHKNFLLWQYIKSGGPAVRKAKLARRKLKGDDFRKVGKWVDDQLKKYDVWVILMPINQINSDFMIGVQTTSNWRMAFLDNYQFMMINIDTDQGKKLLGDILNKKAKYPNEYTQHLAIAKNLLLFQNPARAKQGLGHAIQAFEIENSQAPMQLLVHDAARRHPELRGQANKYIKQYMDKFIANKDEYSKQGGYTKKLVAAMIAANHLATQSAEYRKKYGKLDDIYKTEQKTIGLSGRW